VARPTYADLILSFTPAATTKPTLTDVGNIITALFKKAFFYIYGAVGHYVALGDTYVDSEEVYAMVISRASSIVNQFSRALSVGSAPQIITQDLQYPRIDFSGEEIAELKMLAQEEAVDVLPQFIGDQLDTC
jgi:hypothetical protein